MFQSVSGSGLLMVPSLCLIGSRPSLMSPVSERGRLNPALLGFSCVSSLMLHPCSRSHLHASLLGFFDKNGYDVEIPGTDAEKDNGNPSI